MSTLWQVPDRQSAQRMPLFFGHLSKGRGKAEALRRAQIRVIEERREDSVATQSRDEELDVAWVRSPRGDRR